jgi:hypothetical protein
MLPHFEYSVSIPVSVDAAFQAFQNLDRLLHRGIYLEASWIQGKPWEVGSRLRYIVIKPIKATIFAVVSSLTPPRAVSLLNHALGVIADQQVYFGPDPKGGTRVRVMVELVGESAEVPEKVIQETALFLVKDALDTLPALFDRPRRSSASGT